MNDTQTQIERLIELAIVQRSELKQLVSELPQLREHLNAEIERTFEEAEPQIRTELEEFCRARATDEHAKTGAALAAKVEELSKQLEVTTAAKYSVLMAERAENANLLAKAEARIEDAASMLSSAVKEIVTDELSRFPRAGEIDQLRKEFAEPRGLNPRGRWMPDETYQRLDLVTINGDSFVSNIDGNRERPSRTAGDWTLSAARGNGGGGGGVTTMTDLVPVPSNGQLLIGNGSAFVNSTLTAGTGISISNGAGSITITATDGNITLDDGTAAAPSLNFTNEPTTGLFRASANVMGFAVNGTSRATMTTTGLTVAGTITPTGSVHAAAGSVGNPSLAFNSDQDTGLFSIGANNLGVAVGGAKVLDVASTGLTVTGALGASSLTSPASTPLTLGTGSYGTALTVASATGAATFAGAVTAPNLTLNSTGSKIEANTPGTTQKFLQFSSDGAGVYFGIESSGAGAFFTGSAAYDSVIYTPNTPLFISTTTLKLKGAATISSTTAGSSGAGALVVAGGISAGAASYFGGNLDVLGIIYGVANKMLDQSGSTTRLYDGSGGLVLSLLSGAATFAGAVTVATGNLIIGTAGNGIDFSATAGTGTSELLNDYEEGTWTPTDDSGAGLSFTVYSATYTKIGRLVEVEAAIYFPSTASTAAAKITGLPFTAAGGDDNTGGLSISATNVGANYYILITRGTNTFTINTNADVGVTNVTYSGKVLKFFGWYHV